eukprot:CAMPEP_0197630630 /NCGR_PEP_ID=MMETSP1338-20131121/8047_1 /TAXON_ID=43686 ORGANISM="Pelagodinium beii, Strain RCC1491" /NCGR_SAMPLE_ID=MMETSP1338 /ASSEMBLY_ACC=CAM_ASM_000754 /LENGTH=298 /DNA_ID=CAMNT_0043201887 /DNA_START=67 /DNA_END=963 /DNA_ORIENTATION=-
MNATLSDCRCAIHDSTSPFVPPEASDDQGLPPCYIDHLPADATTFAVEYENIQECFLGGGWAAQLTAARGCLTRQNPSQPAVFLLGDSHARSLKEGLEAATYKEVLPAMWYGDANADRLREIQGILQEEVRAGDVIWWVNRMGGEGGGQTAMDPSDMAQFEAGANLLYSLPVVQSGAAKLVIVEDWPTLGGSSSSTRGEASLCHLKHNLGVFPTACTVSYAAIQAGRAAALGVINTMAGKPGVYVFNAASYFCPQGVCDYNVPGRAASAYFDYGHLNPFGSHYLWPFMCNFMKTNGLH